ncbi:hypothetical protein AAVH_39138, partial [Aphelenchoides avenae]
CSTNTTTTSAVPKDHSRADYSHRSAYYDHRSAYYDHRSANYDHPSAHDNNRSAEYDHRITDNDRCCAIYSQRSANRSAPEAVPSTTGEQTPFEELLASPPGSHRWNYEFRDPAVKSIKYSLREQVLRNLYFASRRSTPTIDFDDFDFEFHRAQNPNDDRREQAENEEESLTESSERSAEADTEANEADEDSGPEAAEAGPSTSASTPITRRAARGSRQQEFQKWFGKAFQNHQREQETLDERRRREKEHRRAQRHNQQAQQAEPIMEDLEARLARLETKDLGHMPISLPLPTISGELTDLSFTQFLQQLYAMGNAYGWSKKQYAAILPQCLRGEARDQYYLLAEDTRENYEAAVDAIGKSLKRINTPEHARSKLANCNQVEDEPAASFFRRAQTLVHAAFPKPTYSDAQRTTDCIYYFRLGLRPDLHAEAARRKPEDTPENELKKVQEDDQRLRAIEERKKRRDMDKKHDEDIAEVKKIAEKIFDKLDQQQQIAA